jgi:hypothetical protein
LNLPPFLFSKTIIFLLCSCQHYNSGNTISLHPCIKRQIGIDTTSHTQVDGDILFSIREQVKTFFPNFEVFFTQESNPLKIEATAFGETV